RLVVEHVVFNELRWKARKGSGVHASLVRLCAMSGHQLDTRNRTFSFAPTPVLKPHPHNA
ncbi:MAG: hypothetical protein ABN488_16325, partial [Methylobacteriaceae bacterium]